MKLKAFVGILIVLIVIICFVCGWYNDEVRYVNAVRPPPGATNLISFLQMRPGVISIRTFTNANETFFEVKGPMPKFGLALPSGPPAYIFNKAGRLVDW